MVCDMSFRSVLPCARSPDFLADWIGCKAGKGIDKKDRMDGTGLEPVTACL